METTGNFVEPGAETELVLTFEAQTYLREAGKWAVFLSIIGFIICGFIVLAALFAGAMMSAVSRFSTGPMAATAMAGMGGLITVVYLLGALIYFFFSLYLYQFGSRVKKGIMFLDSLHVTNALGKLKSFFKLWGIITIVVLCFYALAIICAILFGLSTSSMMGR